MEISHYARHILLENSLSDKLITPESLSDFNPGQALTEIPHAPGRDHQIRFPKRGERVRTTLPSVKDLEKIHARGILLHFFANHELLALELMALALLRFPEAPSRFRRGLAATMIEEQKHLRLYLERMNTFGVEFGAIQLNRYFWDIMADSPSPLTFVTQMSMTLEQANLDFSRYYMDVFSALRDTQTENLLKIVYEDEIGHVGHGRRWFQAWHDEGMSDWEAYRNLLPLPLTPMRAKGHAHFFDIEARRKAGLSEEFIRELAIFQHSKGRPPRIFWFYPEFEEDLALGQKHFVPTKNMLAMKQDLSFLLSFVGCPDDAVLMSERPSTDFLLSLKKAGFEGCQIITQMNELDGRLIRSFEPWGRSHGSLQPISATTATSLDPLPKALSCPRAVAQKSDAAPLLGSKVWAKHIAQQLPSGNVPGTIVHSEEAAIAYLTSLSPHPMAVIKAPFGTAGRKALRLPLNQQNLPLAPQHRAWLRKVLETQGALVIEPWLEKIADFSVQIAVGSPEKEYLGLTRFLTNGKGQYVGHVLGRKLDGIGPDGVRAYHEQDVPGALEKVAHFVAQKLAQEGYRGPAGVDALLYRDHSGVHLYPLVEINTRYTMGRIALALDRRIHPSVQAQWLHISKADIARLGYSSFQSFAEELKKSTNIQQKNHCLINGIIFTNDPQQAQAVLSVLFIGEDGMQQICRIQKLSQKK